MSPGDFAARKAARREHYLRFVRGWRQRPCAASGRYDHDGSPLCAACDGSGRERYPGPKAATPEDPR